MQAGAVADHRVPARALHLGGVGAVGHADDVPGARLGVGEQAVELEVQAGEAVRGAAVLGRAPRHRQGRGQVGLLGQQVGGPVAHAAGLAQQDLGVVAHHVEQGPLVLGEPRQPRLHAVEHQALGQALPLLAAPRLEADQPLGPLADLVGGQQLAAREQQHLVEVVGRALVGHRELGEPVDLVAPQVDAHRAVGGRREHVDDRARARPARPGARPSPRAGSRRPPGRRPGRRGRSAGPGRTAIGATSSTWGPRRCTSARTEATTTSGARSGVVQPPQHPQAPAHRLDARAHPLERQRLPRREQLDPVVAEEGGQVVRQPLGLGRRRARPARSAGAW